MQAPKHPSANNITNLFPALSLTCQSSTDSAWVFVLSSTDSKTDSLSKVFSFRPLLTSNLLTALMSLLICKDLSEWGCVCVYVCMTTHKPMQFLAVAVELIRFGGDGFSDRCRYSMSKCICAGGRSQAHSCLLLKKTLSSHHGNGSTLRWLLEVLTRLCQSRISTPEHSISPSLFTFLLSNHSSNV